MKIPRSSLPILNLIILAMLLTFVISWLPKSWIEIPLLVFFSALRGFLNGVPEVVVWALLLALLTFIAILSIPRERFRRSEGETTPRIHESGLAKWQRMLERRKEGAYFEWRLSSAMKDLSLEVIAFSERRPKAELLQKLQNDQRILPKAYQEFIQRSIDERSLGRTAGIDIRQADLDLESFIAYLENRLEGRSER
jgi:hypothetical protein